MKEFKMTDNNQSKKTKMPWMIGLVVVLLGSASALAFYLIDGRSAKDTYLLAELNTLKSIEAYIEEKYEEEIAWAKQIKEHPFAHELELSADYNPTDLGSDLFGLTDLINHALIQVKTEVDYDEKRANGLINVNLAGIVLEDVFVELGEEEVRLNTPLVEDTLFMTTKDLAKRMKEEDLDIKADELNFSEIFKKDVFLTEDERKYIVKEYGQFIYNQLDDEAFTAVNEKTKINQENLRTEKISLKLTEGELKELLGNFVDKLASDEKALAILSQAQASLTQADLLQALADLKENLQTLHLKDGFQSDIWVHKDVIVAREINVASDETNFELMAKQAIKKDFVFDYKVMSKTKNEETELILSGKLEKGDQLSDELVLEYIDPYESRFSVTYTDEASTSKNEREFERTLSFNLGESLMLDGSLHWDGVSSYEGDQMSGEHEVYVELEGFDRDLFTLYIDQEAKRIKELKPFSEKGVKKDMGSLTEDEINTYLQGLF